MMSGSSACHLVSQPVEMDHGGFVVTGLPSFNDNFIWVIQTRATDATAQTVVVDPGDAGPVIDYCVRQARVPDQIWLTHHHADHSGGVAELVAWAKTQGTLLQVLGPAGESIPGVTRALDGSEKLAMGNDLVVRVLSLPGHTRAHLGYLIEPSVSIAPPALFCGDVLFGLGCGRLFEGTAAQMAASLDQIRSLPADTRIYCAHEYTAMNLPFALAVDPDNTVLKGRAQEIMQRRQKGDGTVPLLLSEELTTNPFLRCDEPALREAAMLPESASPVEVFARLREMRNTFKSR